jgi:hypothetical protein
MTDTNNSGANKGVGLSISQALEHAEVHFVATLKDEHRLHRDHRLETVRSTVGCRAE